MAEQVISSWRDLGGLLGEVPSTAGLGGMARTVLGVGWGRGGGRTRGHGQGVLGMWPCSLAGRLRGGGEQLGRRQAGLSPRRPSNASLKAGFILQPVIAGSWPSWAPGSTLGIGAP